MLANHLLRPPKAALVPISICLCLAANLHCSMDRRAPNRQPAGADGPTEAAADDAKSLKEERYKELAIQKYANGIEYVPSPEERYVLVKKERLGTPKLPQSQIDFFVYDSKTDSIVYESVVGNGTVKWLGNDRIEIVRTPGNMAVGLTRDDFTDIHDLQTGKTIPKKQFLQEQDE